MYIPGAGKFEQDDTSDLLVDGGIIQFVKQFKYPGSYITQDLKDDFDIDARIKAAGAAIASATKIFFTSKDISHEHKGIIVTVIFTCPIPFMDASHGHCRLLLHCIACKCFTIDVSVPCAARATRWHSQHFHLSQAELEKRIRIKSIVTNEG
jgi:hypothetical protein